VGTNKERFNFARPKQNILKESFDPGARGGSDRKKGKRGRGTVWGREVTESVINDRTLRRSRIYKTKQRGLYSGRTDQEGKGIMGRGGREKEGGGMEKDLGLSFKEDSKRTKKL